MPRRSDLPRGTSASHRNPPAIYRDCLTGNKAAGVAGEEQQYAVEFVLLPGTAHRRVSAHPLDAPLISEHLIGHFAGGPARCDRVHSPALAGPLSRRLAPQLYQSALARRIAPL